MTPVLRKLFFYGVVFPASALTGAAAGQPSLILFSLGLMHPSHWYSGWLAPTIVLGVFVLLFQYFSARNSFEQEYVKIAVSVLSSGAAEQRPLREWATQLLNKYSPVKLPPETVEKLNQGELHFPPQSSSAAGAKPHGVTFSATRTLEFPVTAPGQSSQLEIFLTDCTPGDAVLVSPPREAAVPGAVYSCYPDEGHVIVVLTNVRASGDVQPPPGTFRVTAIHP